MESVCLMSELGLEPSEIKCPMQCAFDFSGRGRTIIEPAFDTLDFSDETIFYSDDNEFSFNFRRMRELLSETRISPYDRIIAGGSSIITTDEDEYSDCSNIFSTKYHFKAIDLRRIKQVCPRSNKIELQNPCVMAAVHYGNGITRVLDIGL